MIGKLSFVNNRWQIVFFNEKKGKDATLFCNESDFASGFSPSREAETEVEFERDNTPQQKPIKIRPQGQQWQGEVKKETIDYSAVREKAAADAQRAKSGKSFRSESPRKQQQESGIGSSINTNYSKDFHNPYNFVHAVPRDVSHAELGDKKPVGHDKFHKGFYSGKLTVKMTVKTPLLVIDTAHVEVQNEHKKYPVRIENGKPFINPTAVKGMLRAAYEAVTNSRFGVLDKKHKDRLAFRRGARSPIPVRIEKKDGKFFAKPLKYQEVDNQVMNHVAKLPRYEKHSRQIDKGESRYALRYSDGSLPKHGDAVWVQYKKIKAGAEVQRIKKRNETDNNQPGWTAGWVCVTGANIGAKVFERVFLDIPNVPLIPVDESLWEELIRNYQDIHKMELEQRARSNRKPSDYLGNTPGQTAWSRHIYTEDDLTLRHGTLCYAEIENNTIKSIFPVMISRQLYECSPLALLDESLRPAESLEKLSPADRVFGWVHQKGSGAYRGQIRIGSMTTERTDAIQNFNDLPLNILGQPKPQQGRFYVAESPNGEAQTEARNNENAGYKQGRGLRGRKVYPHHAHIEDHNFWFENSNFNENSDHWREEFTNSKGKKYFREYLRPRKDNQQQRDSQNRSIKGWVKPKTEFQFDIHFTNLSKVELGALVWLLSLPENHFHRFGGGKPYGFGSVRLEIVSEEIVSGEDLKEFYQSLDSDLENSISAAECKTAFESVANQEILNAFKVACKGFDDCLPIHYPRTSQRPNPEGKSYEWFVENNRQQRGQVVNGYVLPNLTDDQGLPIL